jgi:transcriptional regulator with XRE-family HTH domain
MKETEFNKLFAAKLKFYLVKNDMTQADLAEKLGVGTTSVYNWCSGLKTPRMDKVDKMCEIFGISRSALITSDYQEHEEKSISYSEEEQNLISAYRNASEDTKNAVCAVLGIQRKKESSIYSHNAG